MDKNRNGDGRHHRRRAHSLKGSMGFRRSQHCDRVEDSDSSKQDSLSAIEESTKEIEREEGNHGKRIITCKGKCLN